MNTLDDHVQYQMLFDALNLNNNSFMALSHEYYHSCFPLYTFHTYQGIAGCGANRKDCNLFAADNSNFLLGIPFAANSSHMEGIVRTSTDINWTTRGNAVTNPFLDTLGVTLVNATPATHCIFSAVCDWNLIMMSNDQAIPNQCYSTQTPLNT
jgi:hypothetical protein